MWLKALGLWLAERRHFWLAVFVVAIALLFALRRGVTEPEIRITGLLLQILGIATVAWGIRETRALFGRPSLVTLFREWLRRFPVYGGRIVSASANITLEGTTLHARGYVSANAGPDATVEARIEALEKNLRYTNERIDHTQGEMDQTFRRQDDLLEQEQQTRATEDQEILARLEVTETGGLHISAVGALWLFVGVTLSTAAPELAKCLK